MEIGNKSIYDGKFRGNILVVDKTGCGKTYFLQKLGLIEFFGKLVRMGNRHRNWWTKESWNTIML